MRSVAIAITTGIINTKYGSFRRLRPNIGFDARKPVFGGTGWLVGFVALRPKSTAKVIAGPSVHLTTLFPGQA